MTLTLPDGRRTTFAFAPTVNSEDSIATARWKAPPDVQYGLVPLDSGIINLVPTRPPVWQDTDNTYAPGTLENHDVRGWLLTNRDGTQYVIDRGTVNNVVWDPKRNGQFISVRAYGPPKLTSIHERSGDWIEITDRGLFHRNPTNGLTRSVVIVRSYQSLGPRLRPFQRPENYMTDSSNTITIYLRAFDCICHKCNHRFEDLDFSDFEYGRRMLRTTGGKLALLVCDEDETMKEFSSILRGITGSLSARRLGSLFDKTFGIACDPIAGDPIDASLQHICPSCGSNAVNTFDIVPKKTVLTRAYRIGHTLWETKSRAEKELALRSALGA